MTDPSPSSTPRRSGAFFAIRNSRSAVQAAKLPSARSLYPLSPSWRPSAFYTTRRELFGGNRKCDAQAQKGYLRILGANISTPVIVSTSAARCAATRLTSEGDVATPERQIDFAPLRPAPCRALQAMHTSSVHAARPSLWIRSRLELQRRVETLARKSDLAMKMRCGLPPAGPGRATTILRRP